jgi:modulator of FtsH protease
VGASAALAGLIFVSVSLNLTKVLGSPHLPMRAFQALVVLLEILFMSSLAIVPQSLMWLGGEVLTLGTAVWIMALNCDRKTYIVAGATYRQRTVQRMILSQVAALLFVGGGIAILISGVVGVYWLVPAVICSYLIAMLDAWVLLVEINR